MAQNKSLSTQNVSYRTQGFYVQKGNPKNIKGWSDFGREDISVLNRRVGSSARILMDIQLKRLGISASKVRGYDRIMKSHLTMAAAIAAGEADLAIKEIAHFSGNDYRDLGKIICEV